MTTKTNTEAATFTVTSAEEAWTAMAYFLKSMYGEIVIASGKDTGMMTRIDPVKIPGNVGVENCRQGLIKPITDISPSVKDGETWETAHGRRLKRIANWYAGDYSVRGGGVEDPISSTMKVILTEEYTAAGFDMKSAEVKEGLKGTAQQILARQFEGKELEEELEKYRGLASERIKARSEAAAEIKIDPKKFVSLKELRKAQG